MSAELLAKLKATESGKWAYWLWEFLYVWHSTCQEAIEAYGKGSLYHKETADEGVLDLKKLYTLADWLEGQAFKEIEREIPRDTEKLMAIYHRQKRREDEAK